LYKANNQFEEALETYDIAESKGLDENNGEKPNWMWFLYYFRGVTYDMLDRHSDAEIDLKKALEMEPENATLLNYLGYSYADKGQNLEAAYDMIKRAVEQKPNDAYIVDSMGWVLYRMGRYDEAVEQLELSASLKPYNSVINDHLGDAYWKVGRRLEAKYMWQRAVDYIPDNKANGMDADDDEQAQAAKRAAEKLKTGLQD
jgi:tetratricopeptide (TPR) repeat protein